MIDKLLYKLLLGNNQVGIEQLILRDIVPSSQTIIHSYPLSCHHSESIAKQISDSYSPCYDVSVCLLLSYAIILRILDVWLSTIIGGISLLPV